MSHAHAETGGVVLSAASNNGRRDWRVVSESPRTSGGGGGGGGRADVTVAPTTGNPRTGYHDRGRGSGSLGSARGSSPLSSARRPGTDTSFERLSASVASLQAARDRRYGQTSARGGRASSPYGDGGGGGPHRPTADGSSSGAPATPQPLEQHATRARILAGSTAAAAAPAAPAPATVVDAGRLCAQQRLWASRRRQPRHKLARNGQCQ